MLQLAPIKAESTPDTASPQPTCALCGSEQTTRLWDATDKKYRKSGCFPYWSCQACGVVVLHPAPSEWDLANYYPDYVTPVQHPVSFRQRLKRTVADEWYGYGSGNPWRPARLAKKVVTLPLIPLLSQLPPKKQEGRVLDIGCGSGAYLAFLASLGWICHGVEPGANSRTYAREVLGLHVHPGPLEACRFPDASFDVVTMWHVIEHLVDPVATLREIHRVLRPDGVLRLSTPNVGSLEARLFGRHWYCLDTPRHLFLFTAKTIRRLLEGSGYIVTRLQSEHHPTVVSRSLLYLFENHQWGRARAFVANWIRLIEWGFRICSPVRALMGYGSTIHIEARKAGREPRLTESS